MLKKSQVSTEFMVFVGMAVVLLMIYMAIANNFLNLAYSQKEIISAQDLAKILKNEINLASRVENGYIKEFQLLYQVDYKNYTISIPPNNREISISYEGSDLDFTEMLSTNVTVIGNILKPGNIIFIKKYKDNVFITSPYCVVSQIGDSECITGYENCLYGYGSSTFSVPACSRQCMSGSPYPIWTINGLCDDCNGITGNGCRILDTNCQIIQFATCHFISDPAPCDSDDWIQPYDPCGRSTEFKLCCIPSEE